MSVNPINSTPNLNSLHVSSPTNSRSAVAAALQEASESSATTQQEAAHGDQVAMRKLANQAQQQVGKTAPPPRVAREQAGEVDMTA